MIKYPDVLTCLVLWHRKYGCHGQGRDHSILTLTCNTFFCCTISFAVISRSDKIFRINTHNYSRKWIWNFQNPEMFCPVRSGLGLHCLWGPAVIFIRSTVQVIRAGINRSYCLMCMYFLVQSLNSRLVNLMYIRQFRNRITVLLLGITFRPRLWLGIVMPPPYGTYDHTMQDIAIIITTRCALRFLNYCTYRCTSIMMFWDHYNAVIMSAMASKITSPTVVYSTVYSGVDQRKHQISVSLAFVRGVHWWPVNYPHKGPVTRKMLPFEEAIVHSHAKRWLDSDPKHTQVWYLKWHSIVAFNWPVMWCFI